MKKEAKQARQTDTRQKFMMGGLVIKAGLGNLHQTNPEVILGILIEAKEKLQNTSNSEFSKWKTLGLKAMSDNKTT